jgi:AraC family transcriptional regulator of adaptative response/methylated-DNA-[protein]-cysteine methyltransferase
MTHEATDTAVLSQPVAAARTPARVARLCRLIEAGDDAPPSLAELAAAVGLSPSHTQRMFTQALGLSPHAYAAACRERRVRDLLASQASVTEAIYGAGYGSSGRFYERSTQLLGMTPSAYRKQGPDVAIRFAVGQCSLGAILVARTERGVCAVDLGDEPEPLVRDLEQRFARATLVGADPAFEALVAQVVGLIEQPRVDVRLPLDVRGTAFQQRVWTALTKIPAGETRTYTQLAVELGAPKGARAVARACASNPVAVAIPCHRVVRADGNLAGYRWGIERKRELLAREAAGRTGSAEHPPR